jgi:hypothetical protein
MKYLSILFIAFLTVTITATHGKSVTITLTDPSQVLQNSDFSAALSAAKAKPKHVTELKLVSADSDACWNLDNCKRVAAYFDENKAPALTTLDLSKAVFKNNAIPNNSVTRSSTFGKSAATGAETNGMAITTVILPDNLLAVGERAFLNCLKLEHINLPDGLKRIHTGAFQKTLLSIRTLPNSLVALGVSAFANCIKITEMTFPAGLTSIGQYAFTGVQLKKITFLGQKPPSIEAAHNKASFSSTKGIDVIVPAGAKTTNPAWLQAPWTSFKSVTEATDTGLNCIPVSGKGALPYPATAENSFSRQ